VPEAEFGEKVHGYFLALMKDFVTPMGLPLVTIPKESFDAILAALTTHLGISHAWLVDAATLTATELVGAVAGVVSVALNWTKDDVKQFSALAGSLGLSSLASANPLLAIVALVSLAQAYQKAAHSGGYGELAKGIAKGGFGTGVSMAAAAIIPGAWVGLMVGICAGVLAHKAFEKGEQVLADVDWTEVAMFVQRYLTPRIMLCAVAPAAETAGLSATAEAAGRMAEAGRLLANQAGGAFARFRRT
ncbi:MAG: hypothetical protein WCK65_13145, partial [Rhodospirillaceae bacterium]